MINNSDRLIVIQVPRPRSQKTARESSTLFAASTVVFWFWVLTMVQLDFGIKQAGLLVGMSKNIKNQSVTSALTVKV